MKNLKDTITNICSAILVVCGVVLAINQAGIVLPTWVNTVTTVAGIVATAVIGYLTGKDKDGKPKQV